MNKNAMNRIGNCSRCGKVFVRYRQQSLCPACTEKREQDFMRCRDYLRDNPETRMKELSEATGVSVREIIRIHYRRPSRFNKGQSQHVLPL